MSFVEIGEVQHEVNAETGRAKIEQDLTRYTAYLENLAKLAPGLEKFIEVDTGELVTTRRDGKTLAKPRGRNEKAEAENFKRAAKQMDRTVAIQVQHRGDGKTVLGLTLQPKRNDPPEVQHARNVALAEWRVKSANEDITKLEAVIASANTSPEDKSTATAVLAAKREALGRHAKKLADLQAQSPNGQTPAPTQAPAAKAPAKRQG